MMAVAAGSPKPYCARASSEMWNTRPGAPGRLYSEAAVRVARRRHGERSGEAAYRRLVRRAGGGRDHRLILP